MFDAPAFPRSSFDADAPAMARLRMPIVIGPRDRARFLGVGYGTHLNRLRPCGWHLVVHRTADAGCWTHLYKVVSDHHDRVLVLLHQAVQGDCGEAPERFSRWPLSVDAQGCKAGENPGKDA